MKNDKPTFFREPAAFRQWLATHSQSATELLVGFWKAGTDQAGMSWSEAVDEALCYGWIDGVRRRIDDQSYSIRFSPRRPESIWSAVNIAKFEALTVAGKVTQAGQDAYAMRSEAKSRVYSYEQQQSSELSESEIALFKVDLQAWEYFAACPAGYRRKLMHWIVIAKKVETRASRLKKLIDACAQRKRLT